MTAAVSALLLGGASVTAIAMVFIGIMGAEQTGGPMAGVLYACMVLALAVPLTALWAWRRGGTWPVVFTLVHWVAAPGIFVAASLFIGATATPAAGPPRPAGTDSAAWAAFFAAHPDPEAIDLARFGLDAVPAEVFRMRRLAELVLTGNRITAIPDALLDLPELRIVMLRDNPVPTEELRRFAQVSQAALASGRRARPFAIVQ